MKVVVIAALLSLLPAWVTGQQLLRTDTAFIHFVSEAPLELIEASSNACQGVLDLTAGSFAFRVPIRTFIGFNSPAQKEHFNENYMESESHPYAMFQGRILDQPDLAGQGVETVLVRGDLNIHGVAVERVIEVRLVSTPDNGLAFSSEFTVPLESHRIDVPLIVHQKIAEYIAVTVKGELR
jgi:hypothetical protein